MLTRDDDDGTCHKMSAKHGRPLHGASGLPEY